MPSLQVVSPGEEIIVDQFAMPRSSLGVLYAYVENACDEFLIVYIEYISYLAHIIY